MTATTATVTMTGNHVVDDRPVIESDEYGKFARRILRAYGRRVGDLDIEGLAGLVALRAELDEVIDQAVDNLHGRPYSWTDIARVLGVTRQAAQQRFNRRRTTTTKEIPAP